MVAGTFNAYIVQPEWLTKIGIIPKDAPILIETKLDEPGFRFSSERLGSRWVVSPTRLEVETNRSEEDCGELVARVLTHLPWTPLTGIGTNTVLHAPMDEFEGLPSLSFEPPRVPEYEVKQRTFHVGLQRGDHLFNLQVAIMKEAVEISANVHTDLKGQDSEVGRNAARKFFDHRREALDLTRKIFNARFTHGDSNDHSKKRVNGTAEVG